MLTPCVPQHWATHSTAGTHTSLLYIISSQSKKCFLNFFKLGIIFSCFVICSFFFFFSCFASKYIKKQARISKTKEGKKNPKKKSEKKKYACWRQAFLKSKWTNFALRQNNHQPPPFSKSLEPSRLKWLRYSISFFESFPPARPPCLSEATAIKHANPVQSSLASWSSGMPDFKTEKE